MVFCFLLFYIFNECYLYLPIFCNLSYTAHATQDQLEGRTHSVEEICPEL